MEKKDVMVDDLKNKGGRPRKYATDSARSAAYRQRKEDSGGYYRQVVLNVEATAALNSLKAAARQPNRHGKIISKALIFYAKFKLRGK